MKIDKEITLREALKAIAELNLNKITVKDLNEVANMNITTNCNNGKITSFRHENMTIVLH